MKVQFASHHGVRPKLRDVSAFTLVEVICAVAIILIAFVSIFGSISMGFSLTELTRENLRATQIMVDKLEGVRLYNWSQVNDTTFLTSNFTDFFYDTNNIGLSNASGNGVQYSGTVTVAPVTFSEPYSSNMVQVTVTVNWTSTFRNQSRTRSMVTFASQPGLQNYVYSH
jgi:prepilin-type N-terminal cleavage/methylation domain-containing protein